MSKTIDTFKCEVKIQVPGEGEVKKKMKFAVMEPNLDDYREGKKVYNTSFSNAIKSGAVVREKMDDVLRQQGLWNNEKAAELEGLQRQALDKEKKLAGGGIRLSDAKSIAFEIKELRSKLADLLAPRTQLDVNSAQGQADNEQFNCLVSLCVVYNDTKQRYFNGYDDFLNKVSDDVAIQGANILAKHMYGVNDDYQKKLPENRFLRDFGFVNEKLQLVNEDGDLVDIKNRLVDDDGYLINKDGHRVDEHGVLVTKGGDYIVDVKPFLDDDGEEVDKTWSYGLNTRPEDLDDDDDKADEEVVEEAETEEAVVAAVK